MDIRKREDFVKKQYMEIGKHYNFLPLRRQRQRSIMFQGQRRQRQTDAEQSHKQTLAQGMFSVLSGFSGGGGGRFWRAADGSFGRRGGRTGTSRRFAASERAAGVFALSRRSGRRFLLAAVDCDCNHRQFRAQSQTEIFRNHWRKLINARCFLIILWFADPGNPVDL